MCMISWPCNCPGLQLFPEHHDPPKLRVVGAYGGLLRLMGDIGVHGGYLSVISPSAL